MGRATTNRATYSFPLLFWYYFIILIGLEFSSSSLSSSLSLLTPFFVQAFTLTPSTTPEQIIQNQLLALQQNDMNNVYVYASPANKANVGNDLTKFTQMVQSGPYKYLIGHTKADILLSSNMAQSKQFLVRVIPKNENDNNNENNNDNNIDRSEKSLVEFWWSLSRVRSGPNKGCFMVDAVIPNA